MNKTNKIIISRIIVSIIIISLLIFPFHQVGLEFPTFLINGTILIDLKYILVGVLFVIVSLTDFFVGYFTTKYNSVTKFVKMIGTINDKTLNNSVLIILACNGNISTVITVVIFIMDIVVDSIKKFIGNNNPIGIDKLKNCTLTLGISLTLFYNLPFEFLNLRISNFLLAIASIFSVISAYRYYIIAKLYLKDR